jgi:DNA-binding NtrC family response regulator
MQSPAQILVVSSAVESRRSLTAILDREGLDTICASRISECREILSTHNVNLVFCERRLTDGTYRDLLEITRQLPSSARVIVTSRLADWDEYLEALHHGAFDLIASPCQLTDVQWALLQARREDHVRSTLVSPEKTSEKEKARIVGA